MGEQQALPYYLCAVREACDTTGFVLLKPQLKSSCQSLVHYIKTGFRGTPGQALIDNESFALTDESGNTIQKPDWENIIHQA